MVTWAILLYIMRGSGFVAVAGTLESPTRKRLGATANKHIKPHGTGPWEANALILTLECFSA